MVMEGAGELVMKPASARYIERGLVFISSGKRRRQHRSQDPRRRHSPERWSAEPFVECISINQPPKEGASMRHKFTKPFYRIFALALVALVSIPFGVFASDVAVSV